MLIGDVRKKGKYYSPIKDLLYFGEIDVHMIKTQHNTVSDRKKYNGHFIAIAHDMK